MNIRQAILKAADHIEANPQDFYFMSTISPSHPGCGTPGCAIGWIGTFSGIRNLSVLEVCEQLGLGNPSDGWDTAREFYRRMDQIEGSEGWIRSANICARTLRAYADQYHPEEPPAVQAELDRIFQATRERATA